jgi:hypothetical protein
MVRLCAQGNDPKALAAETQPTESLALTLEEGFEEEAEQVRQDWAPLVYTHASAFFRVRIHGLPHRTAMSEAHTSPPPAPAQPSAAEEPEIVAILQSTTRTSQALQVCVHAYIRVQASQQPPSHPLTLPPQQQVSTPDDEAPRSPSPLLEGIDLLDSRRRGSSADGSPNVKGQQLAQEEPQVRGVGWSTRCSTHKRPPAMHTSSTDHTYHRYTGRGC